VTAVAPGRERPSKRRAAKRNNEFSPSNMGCHKSGQTANSGGLASCIGRSPERAESVTAFRERSLGAPDVVPGEVHKGSQPSGGEVSG
jgi:hypothetical protein